SDCIRIESSAYDAPGAQLPTRRANSIPHSFERSPRRYPSSDCIRLETAAQCPRRAQTATQGDPCRCENGGPLPSPLSPPAIVFPRLQLLHECPRHPIRLRPLRPSGEELVKHDLLRPRRRTVRINVREFSLSRRIFSVNHDLVN